MASAPNVTPRWYSLPEFCGDCAFGRECRRFTLRQVIQCPVVHDQWQRNIETGVDLGPPAALHKSPELVVRTRPAAESAEPRRGRRPLNERGVQRLLKAVLVVS